MWIDTRSEPEYPRRLDRRLRADARAILSGSGNKTLMNAGGIAVAGSRDADEPDISLTWHVGRTAAAEGYAITPGGTRGVDLAAMLGALESGGTAVGVVAESLVRLASFVAFRKRIIAGQMALVSAFHPEAGFSVGRAMARNRHVYCMSDAAVVVCSGPGKGGTWNGAIENLRAGWVPLRAKHDKNWNSGNRVLMERGAVWLPDELPAVTDLISGSVVAPPFANGERFEPVSLGEDGREANTRVSIRTSN